MFDSIQELPDTALGNVVTADSPSGPVAELLEGDEQPRHVLAGDSVEYETAERTTTLEPDSEHHAYLIVTDDRVLVVLGERPSDSEIEFELRSVSRAAVEVGLLSSTLVVEDGAEAIRLSPTHGDPDAVAEYITVMAEAYADVEDAITSATEMTEELEDQVREGETIGYLRLQIQSELSDARYSATHEKIHTDRLLEKIESTEEALNRRYVDAWVDQARDALERAERALDADEYTPFCEAYVTAADALTSLRDVLSNLDDPPEEVSDEVEETADAVEGVAEAYVESTRNVYERATDADAAAVTATCWLETYRRVMAAREAGWETTTDSTDLPISEIESIAEATVDALQRHADALMRAGERALDDDVSEAREYFERAVTQIRQAQEIVETQAVGDSATYDEQLAELQEKIEVTEWEWGGT
ncbi:hypothetical protein [Halorhabdus rudnickae]|uniref:hypothetical protein n=1 Tax=Halorhabdus rudnickae TaxID=1775544 RepID=UPI00108331FA|nr:hypothetical protein [Halorhabdus rudnickae]